MQQPPAACVASVTIRGGPAAPAGRSADACGVNAPQTHRGMSVVAQGLTYSVRSRKERRELKLLDGVTAFAQPGQLTALMGPSGSGKTTLLDVLAGRKTAGAVRGDVRFGGATPTAAFLRRCTGYVEQSDTLIPNLTVAEMLMYTAELKRSVSEPRGSKQALVRQLLGRLGLGACADVVIGDRLLTTGVSGGEAKRASIGIALVSDPRVLFLDEPTSGLDSHHARGVVALLHGLAAQEGTTVVATVHSPTAAAFELFDAVLMLAQGRVACFGAREALLAFARECWPAAQLPSSASAGGVPVAEQLLEVVTEATKAGTCAALAATYQASPLCTENEARAAELACGSSPSPLEQQLSSLQQVCVAKAGGAGGTPSHSSAAGDEPCRSDSTCSGGGGGGGAASSAPDGRGGWLAGPWLGTCSGTATPWWWALWALLRYRTLVNYKSRAWVAARTLDKVFVCAVIVSLYVGTGDDFTRLVNMSAALFMWCGLPAFGAVAYMPSLVTERKLFYRERADGLFHVGTYLLAKMLEELSLSVATSLAFAAAVFYSVRYVGSFALFWLTCLLTHAVGVALSYTISALSPTMDLANAAMPAFITAQLFLAGQLATLDSIPAWWRWASTVDFVRWSWCALMANQFSAHNPPFTADGVSVLEYYSITPGAQWRYMSLLFAFFAAYTLMAYLALSFIRHGAR